MYFFFFLYIYLIDNYVCPFVNNGHRGTNKHRMVEKKKNKDIYIQPTLINHTPINNNKQKLNKHTICVYVCLCMSLLLVNK